MRRLTRIGVGMACLAASGALAIASASRSAPVASTNAGSSTAKVALGRRLFYEPDLSLDGTMSCATCHEQQHGFADGNATHGGIDGRPGRRNVPGLANVASLPSLTWGDPRVRSLEAQALIPITGTHPVEMGMAGHEVEIARRLGADRCYRTMFAAAFPDGGGAIGIEQVTTALAAFERALISRGTAYDRYLRGRRTALSPDARQGLRRFEARGCAACHGGPDLTDGAFHAIAPSDTARTDPGLYEITGRPEDKGRFRTPGLRNVAITGPYLHDGSARTIAEAVRAHAMAAALSEPEINSIEVFLPTMTDIRMLKSRRFSIPSSACG